MRKKLNYIFFTLILLIAFKKNVLADMPCKYYVSNENGTLTVEFNIKEGASTVKGIIKGYTYFEKKGYEEGNEEKVRNWSKKFDLVDITGKEYYEEKKSCPPYAIVSKSNTGYNLFVSDEQNLAELILEIKDYFPTLSGIETLQKFNEDLLNIEYKINFHSNKDGADGTMNSITVTYGDANGYLPKNEFHFYGYTPIGWMVKNNSKWLCKKDENGTLEYSDCDEDDRYIIGDQASSTIEFDPNSPTIDLYMKWQVNSTIDSQSINQYNLGQGACENRGFVWNETKYGDYCNTDNLQYVLCGDSFDIPNKAPELISFAVNLLKIATPIILIIVSIITLVKAIIASKEDEIKKAQSSLIKKLLAATMVFFIVSIVQFVILKVADSSDANGISKCMSCFLNNDCSSVTYYKTSISNNYYCTKITESGIGDKALCDDFYQENS